MAAVILQIRDCQNAAKIMLCCPALGVTSTMWVSFVVSIIISIINDYYHEVAIMVAT